MSQSSGSVSNFSRLIAAYEPRFLIALVLLILGVNGITCEWTPLPWCDETAYADPAIRFIQGKGFTSTNWPSQPSWEFWASNSPLHQFLLIPWLGLFKISTASVRIFNLVVGGLAVLILWHASKRGSLISGAGPRLAFASLLLLGFGMTHLFRYGRPDAITLLVAAAMTSFATLPSSKKQQWLLFGASALVPWAGLQMIPFIAGILIVLFFLKRQAVWRPGFIIVAGVIVGGAALLGVLAANGVAVRFLENTVASGHTITGEVAQMALMKDAHSSSRVAGKVSSLLQGYHVWFLDHSFPWLMLFLLVTLIWSFQKGVFNKSSVHGFSLMAGLGVPLLVLIAGKYPIYYTWMGYSLVALGVGSVLGCYWAQWSRSLRFLLCLPLAAAAYEGVPSVLVQAMQGRRADLPAIAAFVQQNLHSNDHAIVTDVAYYGAIEKAAEVYYTGYSGGRGLRVFPPEQAARVSVLIIEPSALEGCVKKVGGSWQAVSHFDASSATNAYRLNQQLALSVYRRTL